MGGLVTLTPDKFTSPSRAPGAVALPDGAGPCQSCWPFPTSDAAHPPPAAPAPHSGAAGAMPVPGASWGPGGMGGGLRVPGCCGWEDGAQAVGMPKGTAGAFEPTAPRSDAGENLGLPFAVPLGPRRGEEPGRRRSDIISAFFCLFLFCILSELFADCKLLS